MYPLGIRFCSRGSLSYLETNNSQCSCSILIGDPKKLANRKRKYFTDLGLCFLWKFNLPLTPCSLSPLPIYTISPLVSPSSYIPCLLGTRLSLARVNGDHRFVIGIITSYMKTTLQLCYNIATYKSPPVVIMALGGFEPPRQLASKPQTCHVCQFHHSADYTAEGTGKTQDDFPSADLQLISYHNLRILSILICGKSDTRYKINYVI